MSWTTRLHVKWIGLPGLTAGPTAWHRRHAIAIRADVAAVQGRFLAQRREGHFGRGVEAGNGEQ